MVTGGCYANRANLTGYAMSLLAWGGRLWTMLALERAAYMHRQRCRR